MRGLIGTGENYRTQALSGFVRQSAGQAEIEQANQQMESQRKMQQAQMTGTMAGAGAVIGAYAGAGTAVSGPGGALIGLGVGFLLSRLF
jgi:hypothetical protein